MKIDRSRDIFLSRLAVWQNRQAWPRMETISTNIEYDPNLSGWWIKRGSTAHSLAALLGFDLWDPQSGKPQPTHLL